MTYQKNQDGRITAEHNELQVLYWINRFGGLTTRQLGRLHWTDQLSGIRMPQKTVSRSKSHKRVIERRLPSGGCIYVLSEAGARFLLDHGFENVSSRGQRDLSFAKPMHRLIANEFVIDRHLEGFKVWTEFEVQRNLAPVPEVYITKDSGTKKEKTIRKIPDALIEFDGYLEWVEIENARKNNARLSQLIRLANFFLDRDEHYSFTWKGEEKVMSRFNFITPNELTYRAIKRAISREKLEESVLTDLIIWRAEMTPGYVWKGSNID